MHVARDAACGSAACSNGYERRNRQVTARRKQRGSPPSLRYCRAATRLVDVSACGRPPCLSVLDMRLIGMLISAALTLQTTGPATRMAIRGAVINDAGKSVPQITVVLSPPSGETVRAVTDELGSFRFDLVLQPGRWELDVSGALGTAHQSLDVQAGSGPVTDTVLLVLSPRESPGAHYDFVQTHTNVTVFYATDRNQEQPRPLTGRRFAAVTCWFAAMTGCAAPSPLYGSRQDPGGEIHYGQAVVSVPGEHKIGHIERPGLFTLRRLAANKDFILSEVRQQTDEQFYAGLRSVVGQSEAKQAFVFVHGFNHTFDDALFRTAQLAYDLNFDGAPIVYSWPSVGAIADYPVDLNNNDWTVPHLRSFLDDVSRRSNASTIHLIAHSMGNRALLNALAGMAPPEPGRSRPRFNQLVLTAPDIDAGIFRQLAKAMRALVARATLYASSKDLALEWSKRYQGYPRAGDTSSGVVIVPDVDTIDVSGVDLDFLGHSYYGDNRSVIADMFNLLAGTPPNRRAMLRAAHAPAGDYWVFQP